MKWLTFVAGVAGIALAITGCQDPALTGPSGGPSPPLGRQHWTMPNLVGSNLQQAQDKIQALTNDAIFLTNSHDATGKRRARVLDSNWKVCSQSIAPGTSIVKGTKIDFGAVKLAENCP